MTTLLNLDDGCLLQIMSRLDPSPDVFLLARVCLRFKRLAHDSRNWLVVAPSVPHPHQPWQICMAGQGLNSSNLYRTLQTAVSASRPGDTILLLPGTHHTTTVVLDKPLSLQSLKSGLPQHAQQQPQVTGECILMSTVKAEAALDVRATCRVSGLSIHSQCGPCVLHRSGQLQLDRCHLVCDPLGLDHLCTPLVTVARGPTVTRPAAATAAAGVASSKRSGRVVARKKLADSASSGGHSLDGVGKLQVTECLLEGGCKAVACEGSGALEGVRVIYNARKTVFWLTVDCRSPNAGSTVPPRAGHHSAPKRQLFADGDLTMSQIVNQGGAGLTDGSEGGCKLVPGQGEQAPAEALDSNGEGPVQGIALPEGESVSALGALHSGKAGIHALIQALRSDGAGGAEAFHRHFVAVVGTGASSQSQVCGQVGHVCGGKRWRGQPVGSEGKDGTDAGGGKRQHHQ